MFNFYDPFEDIKGNFCCELILSRRTHHMKLLKDFLELHIWSLFIDRCNRLEPVSTCYHLSLTVLRWIYSPENIEQPLESAQLGTNGISLFIKLSRPPKCVIFNAEYFH